VGLGFEMSAFLFSAQQVLFTSLCGVWFFGAAGGDLVAHAFGVIKAALLLSLERCPPVSRRSRPSLGEHEFQGGFLP